MRDVSSVKKSASNSAPGATSLPNDSRMARCTAGSTSTATTDAFGSPPSAAIRSTAARRNATSEAGFENPVSGRTSRPSDEESGDDEACVEGPARLLNVRQQPDARHSASPCAMQACEPLAIVANPIGSPYMLSTPVRVTWFGRG